MESPLTASPTVASGDAPTVTAHPDRPESPERPEESRRSAFLRAGWHRGLDAPNAARST